MIMEYLLIQLKPPLLRSRMSKVLPQFIESLSHAKSGGAGWIRTIFILQSDPRTAQYISRRFG